MTLCYNYTKFWNNVQNQAIHNNYRVFGSSCAEATILNWICFKCNLNVEVNLVITFWKLILDFVQLFKIEKFLTDKNDSKWSKAKFRQRFLHNQSERVRMTLDFHHIKFQLLQRELTASHLCVFKVTVVLNQVDFRRFFLVVFVDVHPETFFHSFTQHALVLHGFMFHCRWWWLGWLGGSWQQQWRSVAAVRAHRQGWRRWWR